MQYSLPFTVHAVAIMVGILLGWAIIHLANSRERCREDKLLEELKRDLLLEFEARIENVRHMIDDVERAYFIKDMELRDGIYNRRTELLAVCKTLGLEIITLPAVAEQIVARRIPAVDPAAKRGAGEGGK